jgi:hypothetical protein
MEAPCRLFVCGHSRLAPAWLTGEASRRRLRWPLDRRAADRKLQTAKARLPFARDNSRAHSVLSSTGVAALKTT